MRPGEVGGEGIQPLGDALAGRPQGAAVSREAPPPPPDGRFLLQEEEAGVVCVSCRRGTACRRRRQHRQAKERGESFAGKGGRKEKLAERGKFL